MALPRTTNYIKLTHNKLSPQCTSPGQKIITEPQANTALVAKPMSKLTNDWDIDWGLEHQVGIILDHWWVPLATAPIELLQRFETQYKSSKKPQRHAKIQK